MQLLYEVEEIPWVQSPLRLINWWEMEQFSARGFFLAGCLIETLKNECLMGSMAVPGDEPIYNLAALVDDRIKKRATTYLKQIEDQCRSIGLPLSADTAKSAQTKLEKPEAMPFLNYQWLRDKLSDLKELIGREMANHGFFYISPDRGKYWPKMDDPHAFGKSVADAFASSFFDTSHAGMCLAIGLGTASVFHAMRVLEIGLTGFAGVFGISMAHTNWEPAIREIESKVREMHKDPAWKALPDCKEKQEKYAQAASHDVARNSVES